MTYIETTSSHVCADKGTLLCVAKLKEGICTRLLLHFAVKMQDGQIDKVEEFAEVFDGVTAGEEDLEI